MLVNDASDIEGARQLQATPYERSAQSVDQSQLLKGPDRALYRGERIPVQYRSRPYVLYDWYGHSLSAAPRCHHRSQCMTGRRHSSQLQHCTFRYDLLAF